MVIYVATFQSLFVALTKRFLIVKEECTEVSSGAWPYAKEGRFFNNWATLIHVFRNGCASWTQYLVHMIFMDVRKRILIYLYIQQDATLHSLFYLETALHVSAGTTTFY